MSGTVNKNDSCICPRRESKPSQWEQLLRNFSQSHKEECRNVQVNMPRMPRSLKTFPTGSTYVGTWDVLGMSGKGIYTFPNGVVYEGGFLDGDFHGDGEFRYPNGAVLQGKWIYGDLYERNLIFPDGVHYREQNWHYCKAPDRRFSIEYEEGLQPAGRSFLTAEQPTREIPLGFYDTGDGFFDPITKAVYRADDLSSIVRSPTEKEQKWIIENCRANPDPNMGPRKDLYEQWTKANIKPRDFPLPPVASKAKDRNFMFTYDVTAEEWEDEVRFRNLDQDSEESSNEDGD